MNSSPQSLPIPFFEFIPERNSCPGEPLLGVVAHGGRDIPYKWIRNGRENRPTLVLLHGMGVTAATFAGIAPYLFENHDLLVVDYNSFGAAGTWPAGGVALRLLAAGIWHVVDKLNLARVSLVGSSLGGGLALLMTLQQPARVGALGLLNPAVYPQELPLRYRLLRVPIVGECLMAITPPERLIEGIRQIGYSAAEKMPRDLWLSYRQNMADYRNRLQLMDVVRHLPGNAREFVEVPARLREIQTPTCIVWGVQERLILPNTGRQLATDLPNARLHEFADLAHLPHEEDPARVGPVLRDFFNSMAVKN